MSPGFKKLCLWQKTKNLAPVGQGKDAKISNRLKSEPDVDLTHRIFGIIG